MECIYNLSHSDIKLGFQFTFSDNIYMIIGINYELIKNFENQKTTITVITLSTKEINRYVLSDSSVSELEIF